MRREDTVELGDRFQKVGTGNIFTITRLVDPPGLPPHAVLKGEWQHMGELLMSVSALLDRSLYRRAYE